MPNASVSTATIVNPGLLPQLSPAESNVPKHRLFLAFCFDGEIAGTVVR
jgi:hypothetical protein